MDVKKEQVRYETIQKEQPLSFTVNGIQYDLMVNPTKKLTTILRDTLQLTGTKVSCEVGRCGACTILLDGEMANACLLMAFQVNGKEIETIEGVATTELDHVQTAFLQEGGFQCGYCTSGMIVAVKNLIESNSCPTNSDISEHLSGNLCRCTGYGGIIRAVQCLANEN